MERLDHVLSALNLRIRCNGVFQVYEGQVGRRSDRFFDHMPV
jgi:hypothetical protein